MRNETYKLQSSFLAPNKKNKISFANQGIILFFYFYFFIRLWTSNIDNLDAQYQQVMVVPFFKVNSGGILFTLAFLVLFILTVTNRFKIDKCFPFFMLRIGLYFLPLLYIQDTEYRWGTAFSIIQTMIVYYIGFNYRGKIDSITHVFMVGSFILMFQIFLTLQINQITIFSESLKWYMRLPGGKTNSLGALLVSIYIFIDTFCATKILSIRKKIFKTLYYILLWISLLATATRSGVVLLIGYYIFKSIKWLIRNSKISIKSFISISLFLCLIIVLFIYVKDEILNRLSKFTVHSMTDNRMEVYKETFKLIAKYPLFGRSAYKYLVFDTGMAHNFLLESLVQTGIVGTSLYLILLVYAILSIKKIKEKKVKSIFLSFIFVTLLHGMVEPNLFALAEDTMVWFIIGLGVGYSKRVVYDL